MVKVFISYARADLDIAKRIYKNLRDAGMDSCLNIFNILFGKNSAVEIEKAISKSSFFIVLLSKHSMTNRGYIPKEINQALAVLNEIPAEVVIVISLRLDSIKPRHEKIQKLQWGDFFPYLSQLEIRSSLDRTIKFECSEIAEFILL